MILLRMLVTLQRNMNFIKGIKLGGESYSKGGSFIFKELYNCKNKRKKESNKEVIKETEYIHYVL